MWVLVPVISGREADSFFTENLSDKSKVVLVFVADKKELGEMPAEQAGRKIEQAEKVIDKIKKQLPKSINVADYTEWGKWIEKIESIAKLEKTDLVMMAESKEADALKPLLDSYKIKYEIISSY